MEIAAPLGEGVPDGPGPWEIRVTWEGIPGFECPRWTNYEVQAERAAIDRAVSIMDGCRHPDAPVKAMKAEIRIIKGGGPWRVVAAGPAIRSYI